jgi:hypothetical protein
MLVDELEVGRSFTDGGCAAVDAHDRPVTPRVAPHDEQKATTISRCVPATSVAVSTR